jgi:hypothetical protein
MSEEQGRSFWVSLSGPAPGGGMNVNVAKRDDRWVVIGVYVHGPEVTPSVLQAVPVGQIERMLNLLPLDLYDMATFIEFGANEYRFLDDPDGELSLGRLREEADGAPSEFKILQQIRRPKLTRPDGTDPDAFYSLVADAYREYAPQTSKPGTRIAEEAGVPIGTAHGWIREARRRGHLPPGRKGKAG